MDKLPKVEARCYNFEPRELPSNSYLNLGGNYGKFVPFIICGEGGLGEHKMLNWTNLFLLNKLGGHIGSDAEEVIAKIKVEKDIKKIKELIEQLPPKIAEYLDELETDEQMKILSHLTRNMDEKVLDLHREIRGLGKDMMEVKQALREIHVALGCP